MSVMFDDDILTHHIATPGLDGDGIDSAEAAALRSDLAAMLARPDVRRLLDLLDVTGTPEDGATIVYDEDDDEWQVGSVAGAIARVDGHNSVEVEPNVSRLTANVGLTAVRAGQGWVALQVRFAGSGTTNFVARWDHTHPAPYRSVSLIAGSGSMSGGTRTLASGNIGGLQSDRSYRISARLVGDVQGGGTGAGYTMPVVTLNGASVERFGEVRSVSGVPREWTVDHGGVNVSGVTSIPYVAAIQYRSGDPINIGAGAIIVHVASNR